MSRLADVKPNLRAEDVVVEVVAESERWMRLMIGWGAESQKGQSGRCAGCNYALCDC